MIQGEIVVGVPGTTTNEHSKLEDNAMELNILYTYEEAPLGQLCEETIEIGKLDSNSNIYACLISFNIQNESKWSSEVDMGVLKEVVNELKGPLETHILDIPSQSRSPL